MPNSRKRKTQAEEEIEEEIEEVLEETSSDTTSSGDITESSSHANSDSEEEEEKEENAITVNVSFDFDEPRTSDFHALKALLTSYAPGQGVDRSALADAIIAAPGATLIRATQEQEDEDGTNTNTDEDEGNVVGVGAVLFGEGLLRGLFGEGTLPARVMGVERVVVIERLMNSPPQLGGPLLRAIFEGENKKKKKKKTSGKKGHKYVVVGKVWEGEGGERGYALPEFGCVVEEGVSEEVVWVRGGGQGGQGGGWGRFVAVVGLEGVEGWIGRVESEGGE